MSLAPSESPSPALPDGSLSALRFSRSRVVLGVIAIAVVALTVAVFLPALDNQFVAWDDGTAFLENPHYRGLGPAQLEWMWTTFRTAMYRPLTWMTYGADYVLWEMDPWGYHLTSLLIHAANALLVYLLALRLLRAALPDRHGSVALGAAAAVAALLFAIHPMRVEAVAWVSARADLLSGFLLLLTIHCYLTHTLRSSGLERRTRGWLLASVALYAIALFAKPSALAFFIVLAVLDVYPLRRLSPDPRRWLAMPDRTIWLEKLPFLLVALAVAPVVLFAKISVGLLNVTGSKALLGVSLLVYGMAFHLWKLVWPFDLSPLYEMAPVVVALGWRFLLAAAVLVSLTVLFFVFRRRCPGALAAWICYLVLLAPTSGIVPYGAQVAADRYTYLAALGWAMLGGGGLLLWLRAAAARRIAPSLAWITPALAAALLVGLGVLSYRQNAVWRDSESLWSQAVEATPDSAYAHNNLANTLVQQNRFEEAHELLKQAVRLDAGSEMIRLNFANLLVAMGRYEEGRYHLQKAVEPLDDKAVGYNLIGTTFLAQGMLEEAGKHFETALRLSPASAEPHNNLGIVRVREGRLEEGQELFRRAIQLAPGYADAYNNLANSILSQGRVEEALATYELAVASSPDVAPIRANFGDVLATLGRWPEAAEQYRAALALQPDHVLAHNNLGVALLNMGRRGEAIEHLREAKRLDPSLADASRNLDAALALSSE